MLGSLGSPAAISRFSGYRPSALRHTLSDVLPLSSRCLFEQRQQVLCILYTINKQVRPFSRQRCKKRRYTRVSKSILNTFRQTKVINKMKGRFNEQEEKTEVLKFAQLQIKKMCINIHGRFRAEKIQG
jgi:hypothetical protein